MLMAKGRLKQFQTAFFFNIYNGLFIGMGIKTGFQSDRRLVRELMKRPVAKRQKRRFPVPVVQVRQ